MPSRRLTTIFAKRPVPGRVKTRLCPPLAPEEAAELAQAMLDDAVEHHLACDAYATSLAVAPEEAVPWFRARYPADLEVAPQVGAELGERLARWFAARCAAGTTVVALGADCPLLSSSSVQAAHAALDAGADVVFAPDGGGGYSLVGLSRSTPELFTSVEMSTDDMFARTLERAHAAGLRAHLLPEHFDVDVAADLVRLKADLDARAGEDRAGAARPTRTHSLLTRFSFTSA